MAMVVNGTTINQDNGGERLANCSASQRLVMSVYLADSLGLFVSRSKKDLDEKLVLLSSHHPILWLCMRRILPTRWSTQVSSHLISKDPPTFRSRTKSLRPKLRMA